VSKNTRVLIAFGKQLLNVTVLLPHLSPVIKVNAYFTGFIQVTLKKSLRKFVISGCKESEIADEPQTL
jgi:hypothetical protein